MYQYLEKSDAYNTCESPELPKVEYDIKVFFPLGEEPTYASTPRLFWRCEEQRWYVFFYLDYEDREYDSLPLEEWLALPNYNEWLKSR